MFLCCCMLLYMSALCLVYKCVSQRCSKGREWWSRGRKDRLMAIILMGSSSTTIGAIRTGKRASEDWWWWTWSDCYYSDPWTNEHSRNRPSSALDIKVIFHSKRWNISGEGKIALVFRLNAHKHNNQKEFCLVYFTKSFKCCNVHVHSTCRTHLTTRLHLDELHGKHGRCCTLRRVPGVQTTRCKSLQQSSAGWVWLTGKVLTLALTFIKGNEMLDAILMKPFYKPVC